MEVAFHALNPILNKHGCTNRYSDIPGKKLSQFIIAAINMVQVFEDYYR